VTDDSMADREEAQAELADTNDWRVTVRLGEGGKAGQAMSSISTHQVEGEVHRALGGRVMIGTDGHREVYLYAHTADAAEAARQAVSDLLTSQGISADFVLDRWHPVEEDWEPADVAMPETAAAIQAERERLDEAETSESLESGHALFEVRVRVETHRDAVALAARLRSEGYSVKRRWRFLVVGANNADQADEFAARIREEVPPGAVVTTEEVGALLPFTAFDAAAGSGL
jgi:hypothetical protein